MSAPFSSGTTPRRSFLLILLMGLFYLIRTVFNALYWLWLIIKWAFAPVMFLVNVLILMPVGKLTMKMPVALEIEPVTEDDLPYAVWCEFKNLSLTLEQEGFEAQQYVLTNNLIPNTHYYMLSMIHPSKVQGVGINIIVPDKADLDDSELPVGSQVGVEFSTCYGSKKVVDLTNYAQLTPFPTDHVRQRLLVNDASVQSLYRIFDQYEAQTACKITPEIFNQLRYKPGKILDDEYQLLIKYSLDEGYLSQRKAFYQLTWKGVLSSGLRTVWPTSVWFQHQVHKQTMQEMELHGMQTANLWEYEPEPFIDEALKKPCDTLPEALKLAHTKLKQHVTIIPDIEISLISIEIQQPEKMPPASYTFSFRQYQRFLNRESALLNEVTIDINNDESLISVDSHTPELYKKDEIEDIDPATPLLNGLTPYLEPSKVIALCRTKETQSIEEIYTLSLSIEEDMHQWQIEYETSDQQPAYRIIDAVSGEQITSHLRTPTIDSSYS